VAGTEATHVYDEPGTYLVKAAGAEELGYVGFAQRTITIVGEGEEEGEPDPDPETEPGDGGGGTQEGGTKALDAPAPPVTPGVPPGPTQGCLTAAAARDAAAGRVHRLRPKLASAAGANARRRMAAAMRKRQAALRHARARVASAC
jgi:hypothetical protein